MSRLRRGYFIRSSAAMAALSMAGAGTAQSAMDGFADKTSKQREKLQGNFFPLLYP